MIAFRQFYSYFYLAECLGEQSDLTEGLRFENRPGLFGVDPQYADDTTFGGTGKLGKERLDKIENQIPTLLKKFNRLYNQTSQKKEKYQIPKPAPAPEPPPTWEDLENHKNDKILWSDLDYLTYQPPKKKDDTPDWKKCKLPGSCLDTWVGLKKILKT